MVSNRTKLIDDLIANLFVRTSDGVRDDVEQWGLNENVSLSLTFIFPQVYLKAIEILDLNSLTIYQYSETAQTETGADRFSFEEKVTGCTLVLVADVDGEGKENCRHLVDLNQWFCSCDAYKERFDKAVINEELNKEQEEESDNGYDYASSFGFRKDLIFQFVDDEDCTAPICEHLLAYHILQLHHEKLVKPAYAFQLVSLGQWLDIHATLYITK